ncbi:ankyrin repeat-containing domain protein [Pyronema omphalodes]|nr:ankyrin repeat-containing domain protein [Pyronema omphalodes]
MVAALHGYAEVVKFLLEKNCVDINKTEGYGDTPLLYAARNGNSEVVKLLIQHGAAVETRNNDGRIALSLAAQHHRLETLNILLQSSADVNMTDGIYGRTPLIWSFYHPWYREQRNDYHNRNIPEALLSQHGIDVNWQAKDGSTALSRAIECQLHDVEELLRAHGAV